MLSRWPMRISLWQSPVQRPVLGHRGHRSNGKWAAAGETSWLGPATGDGRMAPHVGPSVLGDLLDSGTTVLRKSLSHQVRVPSAGGRPGSGHALGWGEGRCGSSCVAPRQGLSSVGISRWLPRRLGLLPTLYLWMAPFTGRMGELPGLLGIRRRWCGVRFFFRLCILMSFHEAFQDIHDHFESALSKRFHITCDAKCTWKVQRSNVVFADPTERLERAVLAL
jgi:hypothetical protein